MLAAELQRTIADQCPGQKPRFAQDLKPVADAENQSAAGRELLHGLHYRTESCDRAAAQVIAVAESARHNHGVGVAERSFLVPYVAGRLSEHITQGVNGVLVTIGSGELEDGEGHSVVSG